MAKELPVNFNFKAFETVSATVDKINGKLGRLKESTTGFNNRLFILQEGTKSWREGLQKAGSAITGVGSKLTGFVTAPLALLAGKFLHSALEAEDAAGSYALVFDKLDKAARDGAIERLTKQYDLAESSAQNLMSTTGLFADDIGLSGKAALKMSEDVAALGVKMAGLRNIEGGAAGGAEVVRAAMMGQTKALKKLGIGITDAMIIAEAKRQADRGVRFETEAQGRALVTLALIQQKTAKDTQDFAEGTGSLENQVRVLKERLVQISETLGAVLAPIAGKVLVVFNSLAKKFVNLSPTTLKLVVIFGAVAAALGPLLLGLGFFVGTIMPALITGASVLAAAFGAISWPVLAVVAGIAALSLAGYALVKNWETVKAFFSALWNGPLGQIAQFALQFVPIYQIPKLIIEHWSGIKSFFGGLFDWIGNAAKALWENSGLKLLVEGIGKLGQLALFGRGGNFGISQPAGPVGSEFMGAQSVGQQAGGLAAQARQVGMAGAESRTTNDAKVTVDFKNVPKGVQVGAKSSGGPAPFLNLGTMGVSY